MAELGWPLPFKACRQGPCCQHQVASCVGTHGSAVARHVAGHTALHRCTKSARSHAPLPISAPPQRRGTHGSAVAGTSEARLKAQLQTREKVQKQAGPASTHHKRPHGDSPCSPCKACRQGSLAACIRAASQTARCMIAAALARHHKRSHTVTACHHLAPALTLIMLL